MSSVLGVKAPKTDPEVERQRKEAADRAAEEERVASARAAERTRSAALGFRGRQSLISAGTSAGFGTQPTLGG